MVRTWKVLSILVVLILSVEAFKKSKRQEEEKKCCLPEKYVMKTALRNVEASTLIEGDYSATSETFDSWYRIVDGQNVYISKNLDAPDYVVLFSNGQKQTATYSDYRKCYNYWERSAFDFDEEPDCLDVTYSRKEEVDGESYDVFTQEVVIDDVNNTVIVYAKLDDEGKCLPQVGIDTWATKTDDLTYTLQSIKKYEYLELTSDLKDLIRIPPSSQYCQAEKSDDSPAESTAEDKSASSEDSSEATEQLSAAEKRGFAKKQCYFAKGNAVGNALCA